MCSTKLLTNLRKPSGWHIVKPEVRAFIRVMPKADRLTAVTRIALEVGNHGRAEALARRLCTHIRTENHGWYSRREREIAIEFGLPDVVREVEELSVREALYRKGSGPAKDGVIKTMESFGWDSERSAAFIRSEVKKALQDAHKLLAEAKYKEALELFAVSAHIINDHFERNEHMLKLLKGVYGAAFVCSIAGSTWDGSDIEGPGDSAVLRPLRYDLKLEGVLLTDAEKNGLIDEAIGLLLKKDQSKALELARRFGNMGKNACRAALRVASFGLLYNYLYGYDYKYTDIAARFKFDDQERRWIAVHACARIFAGKDINPKGVIALVERIRSIFEKVTDVTDSLLKEAAVRACAMRMRYLQAGPHVRMTTLALAVRFELENAILPAAIAVVAGTSHDGTQLDTLKAEYGDVITQAVDAVNLVKKTAVPVD